MSIKDFKTKFKEHFIPDDDYDDDVEFEEEGEYEEDYEDSAYDSGEQDSYRYSPDSMLNPPEYVKYGEPVKPKKEAPKASYKKTGSNIYNMNASVNDEKPKAKFKLNFIVLNNLCDAVNVADIMMKKNEMVVVNFSRLSDDQKVRATDFLDGAKYVSDSLFTKFTDEIFAYLPKSVELHGDFYDQVDLDNIGSY